MKYFLISVVIIGCLWWSQDSSAKFYKYVDENGVVRFTDRISEIPEGQRPEVYESVAAPPEPEADKTETVKDDASTYDIGPSNYNADSTYGRLRRSRNALVEQQRKLVAERKRLLKQQKNLRNEDEIAAFQQKVADLNSRITAFENKRREYAQEADAYRTER